MRIVSFLSVFLLLLPNAAKAEDRPFISDNVQAEYLETLVTCPT